MSHEDEIRRICAEKRVEPGDLIDRELLKKIHDDEKLIRFKNGFTTSELWDSVHRRFKIECPGPGSQYTREKLRKYYATNSQRMKVVRKRANKI